MLILLGIIMINVIMGGLMAYRQYKIETFRYREENKKFISHDKTPILYESYKSSLSEYFVFAFWWFFNVFIICSATAFMTGTATEFPH